MLRLTEYFLDLFFPRRCVGCGQTGKWLCGFCEQALPWHLEQQEQQLSFIDFLEGPGRELLHLLKYNSIEEAGVELVQAITRQFNQEVIKNWTAEAVLVPVPTTRTKQKKRGYNQAEIIAIELGRWLQLPVWPGALRRSKSLTQVGKGLVERQSQVATAFQWAGEKDFEGWKERPWVLVDDVSTTGSTTQACRDILQAHSPFPVKALTLFRTH